MDALLDAPDSPADPMEAFIAICEADPMNQAREGRMRRTSEIRWQVPYFCNNMEKLKYSCSLNLCHRKKHMNHHRYL